MKKVYVVAFKPRFANVPAMEPVVITSLVGLETFVSKYAANYVIIFDSYSYGEDFVSYMFNSNAGDNE